MIPIGEYISIELIPEPPQYLITEKSQLSKAIVKDISPDITLPFKSGNTIYIIHSKQIILEENIFIHHEHALLYA